MFYADPGTPNFVDYPILAHFVNNGNTVEKRVKFNKNGNKIVGFWLFFWVTGNCDPHKKITLPLPLRYHCRNGNEIVSNSKSWHTCSKWLL